MSIGRKLGELQAECMRLGLEPRVGKRSKPGKLDYVNSLQNYWLDQYEKMGTLTACQRWVHENIESPKLATSETQVKDGVTEKCFNDPNVGFQEKLDGCRCLIAYEPGKGFAFYSRNRSVTDFCFGNYTDQIKGFENGAFKDTFNHAFVLDSELICINPAIKARMAAETVLASCVALLALNKEDSWAIQEEYGFPLRFKVFDVLMYDWKSTMNLPYQRRDEICAKMVSAIRSKAC